MKKMEFLATIFFIIGIMAASTTDLQGGPTWVNLVGLAIAGISVYLFNKVDTKKKSFED